LGFYGKIDFQRVNSDVFGRMTGGMSMVVRNVDVKKKDLFPGASRKVMAKGGKLMLVEVRFDAGTVVEAHAHPHEQASYVVSGKIVLVMDGKEEILGPGDSFYAGPNIPHGVRFLENSVVVDGFTPQREDFL
jgi:quercetin dioxygenase-like cupin family protein